MGRPKSSNPRLRQLNIGLTDAELETIRQRAKAVGLPAVPFGRQLLLTAKIDSTRSAPSTDTASRLIFSQLVRLGNNLNQMVRHLHRTGDPLPADLEPLLRDIRQIIKRGYADGP